MFGATWRAPKGPGSYIGADNDCGDHLVVCVRWSAAAAFAMWAAGEPPTKGERESCRLRRPRLWLREPLQRLEEQLPRQEQRRR